jgi:hypothetical protein
MAALALGGAIFYRRLMTPAPFDIEEIPALVSAVLRPGPGPTRGKAAGPQ